MTRRAAVLLAVFFLLLGALWALDGDDALVALAETAVERTESPRTTPGADRPDLEPIRPAVWPPALGQRYPDVSLLDRDGEPVRLSGWQGEVLLIEPVGMTCPACQGFSGGNELGGYGGVKVPESVWSVERLLERYGEGVDLDDVVFVQLLLYDMGMGPPTPAAAAAWDDHFGISERGGHVLVPDGDLRNRATYDLIPGFQLVDRDFVLRWDASGHSPTHRTSELLGGLRQVL